MTREITLTNLAPHDIQAGWGIQAGQGVPSSAGNRLCYAMIGDSSIPEVCLATLSPIFLTQGHVYYFKYIGYQDERTDATTDVYWPIAEPPIFSSIPLGPSGIWNYYSGVRKISEFQSGAYQIRIDFNNQFLNGSFYVAMPVLVDLTESFGQGNEPNKEFCDYFIPLFSGSIKKDIFESTKIVFFDALCSPSPAYINSPFLISISVREETLITEPFYFQSGDIYSGEV